MSLENNKIISDHIDSLASEVNRKYPGLMDEYKIKDLLAKYKDSEEDLEKSIIPEIDKHVEDMLYDYKKMMDDIEKVMVLKQKNEIERIQMSDLGDAKTIAYMQSQQLNSLAISQLDSKNDIGKYISDVCTQYPVNSQLLLSNYDNLINDQQLNKVKETLNSGYQNTQNDGTVVNKLQTVEEAKAMLAKYGIKEEELESYVSRIAKGETLEVLKELEQRRKEQEKLEAEKNKDEIKKEENEEEITGTNTFIDSHDQVYTNTLTNTKTRKLVPWKGNGFGYTAMLIAIVSFSVGIISTLTYFVISSIFR